MRSGTIIGAGAGFIGGIVAAFVLSILGIKGHEGQIAIGALFGVLEHRRRAWPRVGGIPGDDLWPGMVDRRLVAVTPSPLRFAPWAAAKDAALFQFAVAGLLACLAFGAALAGAFTLFGLPEGSRRDARAEATRSPARSNGVLGASRR